MLHERNPKRDVLALALLAGCVFLALALRTYHPGDPPATTGWPTPQDYGNACGRSGALVAHYLFAACGYGAYFILITLVVIDLLLLARKPIPELGIRAFGWTMTLAGIATLSALAMLPWDGPAIGPGGLVGAAGRAWLETHFAAAGSYVLAISMTIAGLLLCTDYILLQFAGWFVGTPAKGLATMGRQTLRLMPRRGEANPSVNAKVAVLKASSVSEDEAEDTDDEAADSDGPKLKIGGKLRAAMDTDEEADEDDEDEDEDEDNNDEELDEEDEDDEEIAAGPPIKVPSIKTPAASNAAVQSGELIPAEAKAGQNVRIKNLSKKDERDSLIREIEAASRQEEKAEYELPSLELLLANEAVYSEEQEKEVRQKAKQIEKTFSDFGFNVKVVEIETGPVIAQYEVELEAGLRLSKITGLADDLAIAMRVPSVRIVAPIPGKNTVGIEVPNNERQLVRLREVIEETSQKAKKFKIPIFLGKDVAGNPMVVDLAAMPHLLIAGRTGTGKSVCLNSIIVSMLMTRKPDEVRMLMIDPKMVELSPYKTLPHLMHPVVTDMRKAEAILAWAVEKMEERYALLARAGVRHITVFNQLGEAELRNRLRPENDEEWQSVPKSLPFIVIVADEMADLMMTSGKEVEQHIIRLAQKSRAVGIHLILATQKPTVDVITGLIKSNLPARIAFQVASRTDSRVVLDEMGADKLLGNGDMLFLSPGTSTLLRGQGTYLSDEEINKVVEFVSTTEPDFIKELVQLKTKDQDGNQRERIKSRDDLYESAVEVVIRERRGSVSLLQRALGIGYGRAARMVDYMAEDGIVGEYNGSNAREVLMTAEQWAELMNDGAPPPEAPAPQRRNRIVPEGRDTESEPREPRSPPNPTRRERVVTTDGSPRPHLPIANTGGNKSGVPSARLGAMIDGSSALALGSMSELAPWEQERDPRPRLYDQATGAIETESDEDDLSATDSPMPALRALRRFVEREAAFTLDELEAEQVDDESEAVDQHDADSSLDEEWQDESVDERNQAPAAVAENKWDDAEDEEEYEDEDEDDSDEEEDEDWDDDEDADDDDEEGEEGEDE